MQNPPISPEMIVTRMKFDTKAEAPKLHFAPSRWLTTEEYAIVKTQGESDEAKRAVVMTVAAADGVKTAPKLAIEGTRPAPVEVEEDEAPAPAPKAAKAKAKPVEVEEDAEPEVRKEAAKPSAVPAKKGKLADIVSDWDDE